MEIKMPLCFHEDEETGEKFYDFDEMANELAHKMKKKLGMNIGVAIVDLEKI